MMNNNENTIKPRVKIWQQNLAKSNTAQQEMIAAATPNKWNILALQEPWIDHLGKTRANPKWSMVYPTLKGCNDLPPPQIRHSHQHKVPFGISHPNPD
jgi:hypothetical protein